MDQMLKDAAAKGGDAPELYPDETRDVGPQSILKVRRRKTWIEAYVDSQLFYTSNMFLQEETPGAKLTDTSLFVDTVQLAFAPMPTVVKQGTIAPRVGFRYQWFMYGLGDSTRGLDRFNFDAQTLFADVRYRVHGDWIFEGGFEATRLVGHTPDYDSYREVYSELLPRVGVTRQFSFSETKVLSLSYQANFHFSETAGNPQRGVNDRTDQILMAAYNHALTPHWVAQPFYRMQYSYYTSAGGRSDVLHTIGLSCYYFFTPQISLRAFASYDIKQSDGRLIPEYRKFDAGLGANLNIRF